MKKVFVDIVGGTLLLMGSISMVTPIPGGTFMLAAGMVLLICTSPWFRRTLQALRTRFGSFNRVMGWLEQKTGERLGSVLKLTQPGSSSKSGDHCVP